MQRPVEILNLRNAACSKCELAEGCRTICLIGSGNPQAEIMLVGEAPGEQEDKKGEPFIGQAGEMLNNLLEAFDIKRDDVYITNSIKCRPPNNRKPHLNEIRACRSYLIDEIRLVKPKIIIGLGQYAMQSLLEMKHYTVTSNRGAIFSLPERDLKDIPVTGTYHPAAIKRNEDWLKPTLDDIEKALNVLKHGVTKKGIVKYGLGMAPKDTHYVVDIETYPLSPFDKDAEIICIGTSVKDRTAFCMNYSGNSGEMAKLSEILVDTKVLKIAHNAKFEYKWLRKNGFKINGPIFDTMVAAHITDENRPSYGLKELALTYTDMGRYSANFESAYEITKDTREVPIKVLRWYCASDADAEHRLYTILSQEIENQGLTQLFKLTMQGEKIIAESEFTGVNIDQNVMNDLSKKYRVRIQEIESDIIAYAETKEFNPYSSQQLGELLVGKAGLPILKTTKKEGRVAVDKDVLTRLLEYDKSGIVKLIIRLRKLTGDYSKYLDPDKPVTDSDGKIHADFKIDGADTGRYTCRNPNLMAITKESLIRRGFISNFEGGRLLQADYDQGELRILAEQVQDEVMIEAFKSGQDIHELTYSQLFGVPIDEVNDKQRFAAKTINFGILYGIGIDKLAATTGMTYEEAAKFRRDYLNRYEGVKAYIKRNEQEILKSGVVESLFGRKRRITIVDLEDRYLVSSAQRRAVNAPIQGGLHDLNILSMVACHRRMIREGFNSKILFPIHDAVLFDVYPGEEDDLKLLVNDVFCNPDTSKFGFRFTVPLTVSISSGPNWKDLT